MSFQALKQALLAQAQEQAAAIKSELQAQIAEQQQRIAARAQAIEEVIISEATEEGARLAHRIHQDAELEGRARVLQAKQEELDATRQAVVATLLGLPDDETLQLLTTLVAHIPPEKGVVIAGEQHAALIKKLLPSHVSLAPETIPNEGGFIYRTDQMEIDMTIKQLVTQLFAKHRSSIAKILFD